MKLKLMALTASVAIALSSTAIAAPSETYVKGSLGWSKSSVALLNKSSLAKSIGVGQQLDLNLRAELTLNHYNKIKSSHNAAQLKSKKSVSAADISLSVFWEIPTNSLFTPYAGAGVQLAKLKFTSDGFTKSVPMSNGGMSQLTVKKTMDSTTQFGLHGIAGMSIDLDPEWKMDINYKYTHFGKVANSTLINHSVNVGLRYSF